jgi:uncharacterized protein (TIGR02444 family)
MAEAFWTFSTRFYARPGVEAHLLTLQDRDGLEVNLALFCLFAAQLHHALDHTAIEAMRGVGLAWGHEVVGHLRQARRLMKPRASENEAAARLRNEVKAIELAAEKAMQAALADLLVAIDCPDRSESPRAIAAANFAAWFDEEGVDGSGPRGTVAALIDAAFPA